MPLLLAAAALLGLAIGSFLNVVIHRVPLHESLSHPPSRCPACGHPIRARHNVPVVSWLVLRGRCADCRTPISPRYPAVELLTCVLFVALTLHLGHLDRLPALPAYLYFAALGVALLMIDLDVRRLPDVLVLPAYPVLAVLLGIAALSQHDGAALLRALIGAAGLYAGFLALILAWPGGIGFGDVKLAGVVGGPLAYLSYWALALGTFAAFVLGMVAGILALTAGRSTRLTRIPFGPFMIVGALVGIFFGGAFGELYTRLVLNS